MTYFYQTRREPILANLVDPRWLYDGPSSVSYWQMSLNNPKYGIDTILEEEDRHARDRFTNRGAQLILDTAVLLAKKHKTLPPEEAEKFAFAFKEVSDKLAAR